MSGKHCVQGLGWSLMATAVPSGDLDPTLVKSDGKSSAEHSSESLIVLHGSDDPQMWQAPLPVSRAGAGRLLRAECAGPAQELGVPACSPGLLYTAQGSDSRLRRSPLPLGDLRPSNWPLRVDLGAHMVVARSTRHRCGQREVPGPSVQGSSRPGLWVFLCRGGHVRDACVKDMGSSAQGHLQPGGRGSRTHLAEGPA